jgi:hypothetical protein
MNKALTVAGAALSMVALPVATADAALAASTQVALWHMDDRSGGMADDSGHDYSVTVKNVQFQQQGWRGSSFGFSRKPAYVRVGSSTNLNPGTGAYSITVHLRFTDSPSASVQDFDVLRKGLSTTSGGSYKIEVLENGRAYCNFRGSREVSLSGGPDLSDDRWHTVICRRTSSSVQLVVDGATFTRSGSTGTISNSDAMFIGAKDTAGDDQFAGRLDEVSVVKG